jgi:hypothetical protein
LRRQPFPWWWNGFVVVVGFLILAGAVNTAIIGSNGGSISLVFSKDSVIIQAFHGPIAEACNSCNAPALI